MNVIKKIPALLILVGMVLLLGCTSNDMELLEGTPEFVTKTDFETIDWEKTAVEFGDRNIIGNENKSGVIGVDRPSLNKQKWMWHLWGIENPENIELTVVGFHKETGTVHQILIDGWTKSLSGPNNGADAHVPSTVKIPESGEWALLLYTDGKLFDTLIYEIKE